ncbi:MAG: SDR family oxidoreductase [Pirellulales bacterium]|nr:SDR family oxidoreductase [Pirellulales bacterium]
MRVVITGGSGFIGSHLCDRFLGDGHEVVCLDNYLTGSPRNTDHLLEQRGFTRLECDVAEVLPVSGRVDAVLHFASPASPIGYLRNPIETMRCGAQATFLCAELARRHHARLLLASTSEVYGDPLQHPQTETYWGNVNPIGPRSVYDEAKRFAEAAVMAYHREFGLATRIVRIFNTYGPRMQVDDGRALPSFISQALRGEPITVYGDGSQTRSFCYVTDLVDGIVRLLHSDFVEPVNLGNPAELTMRELAEEVVELTSSTSTLVYGDLPEDDPKLRRPDIARAQKVLGWQPSVDRRTGLARTIEYFKAELARVAACDP